jgi:predicted AAA+ superfamily ATPase
MWISRDCDGGKIAAGALPIKVLKGPRQVGKTSVLERLETHRVVYLDDIAARSRAAADPRGFLDALPPRLVLDEASLAPPLFEELKRRVDEQRRKARGGAAARELDVWITGSNQTLLQRHVRESLAGRASYFDLNTLSIHELALGWRLDDHLLLGGWPELRVSPGLDPVRYLNDLIATFIERDIVSAAGIERHAAFTKCLQLTAARVGQLMNYSELGAAAGVELTTVQSWLAVLETNGILRRLQPWFTNLNQRLIKAPKFYFEDVALATRLQGWTDRRLLLASPLAGSLIENLAVGEIARFFINRGLQPRLNHVRSKEKVEIDLLVHLSNGRTVAVEVKSAAAGFDRRQVRLLETLGLDVVERWVVTPAGGRGDATARMVPFARIWDELDRLEPSRGEQEPVVQPGPRAS